MDDVVATLFPPLRSAVMVATTWPSVNPGTPLLNEESVYAKTLRLPTDVVPLVVDTEEVATLIVSRASAKSLAASALMLN